MKPNICFEALKNSDGEIQIAIIERDIPGQLFIENKIIYRSIAAAATTLTILNTTLGISETDKTEILTSSIRAEKALRRKRKKKSLQLNQ